MGHERATCAACGREGRAYEFAVTGDRHLLCPKCPADAIGRKAGPCPDGGRCHHECTNGQCYRVKCCGPLSGVFPGDEWPDAVKEANGVTRGRGVMDRIEEVGHG